MRPHEPDPRIIEFDRARRRHRAGRAHERRRKHSPAPGISARAGATILTLTVVAAFAFFGAPFAWAPPAGDSGRAEAKEGRSGSPVFSGRVVRIVDGDGLVLDSGIEVRLGDFNAPEWNEPGGREARIALGAIALGKRVECRRCEGARRPGHCTSYDRVIATCRLGGERLGDLMRARGIRQGGR